MIDQQWINASAQVVGSDRIAALRRLPGSTRVSFIFAIPFWIVFGAAVGGWALDLFDEGGSFGPLPVAAMALALFAVWQALPWDSQAPGRRKLLSPLFVLSSLALGYVTFYVWGLAVYPIAVANAVFLFGFRRGVAYALSGLPLIWTSAYVSYPEVGVVGASFMTGLIVPMAAFMLGICKLVIDLERSRGESRNLLAELVASNAEIERQAVRVRELAIAEERARLAREVHDALGHHLTAINLQLQNAERFADGDPERARDKVREARASTRAALEEVRRSVRALKPTALDERSGAAALAALARSFDGLGPAVTFEQCGQEVPLPEAVELALYRATQEGLTNAAKHARARRAAVRLAFESGEVRLTIRDEGRGGPDDALQAGFGLSALRQRIADLGGTLSAANLPTGGFALEAALPLPPRSSSEVRTP